MSAATQLPADLVSPDSRCSGNIWRKKDKSQDEFTVGDWQLCFKCPCVWDFIYWKQKCDDMSLHLRSCSLNTCTE